MNSTLNVRKLNLPQDQITRFVQFSKSVFYRIWNLSQSPIHWIVSHTPFQSRTSRSIFLKANNQPRNIRVYVRDRDREKPETFSRQQQQKYPLSHPFAHVLPFRIASLTQIVFYDLYLGIYFPSSFLSIWLLLFFFFSFFLPPRMRMYPIYSRLCALCNSFFSSSFFFVCCRGCNEMRVIFLCSHQSCLVDILIELSWK